MKRYSFSLRELEATFVKHTPSGHYEVADLAEANGVRFLCPRCFRDPPAGPVGTHSIICWFVGRGVPADATPGPGRWQPNPGATIDTLTFIGPSSASVGVGEHWHGFVASGHVEVDNEGDG